MLFVLAMDVFNSLLVCATEDGILSDWFAASHINLCGQRGYFHCSDRGVTFLLVLPFCMTSVWPRALLLILPSNFSDDQ